MSTPSTLTQADSGVSWLALLRRHAREHEIAALGLGLAGLVVVLLLVQSIAELLGGAAPPDLRLAMLGLAAGAMLFVVSHEVIPETHRNGHQTPATLGLMTGFALMMVLDTTLG